MSDADNAFPGFGKLVPGFDFLQNLASQATGANAKSLPQMPNLGSWIAPTLNPEELEKRIQELKAVQFWLDQNATALKATIQALEVQKMTLATLKGMNFSMGELASAFTVKPPAPTKSKTFAGLEVPPSAFQAAQAAKQDEQDDEEEEPADDDSDSTGDTDGTKADKPAAQVAGVVDPMQWWGSLTQQFQTIATDAMKDAAKNTAVDVGKNPVGDAVKAATDMVKGVAKNMADTANLTVAGSGRAINSVLRNNQAWPTPGAAKKTTPAASKSSPAGKAKPKAAAKAPARKTAVKSTAKTARKTSR